MVDITREQCDTIVRSYLKHDNYKIINYSLKTADDASMGYLSLVSCLNVQIKVEDERDEDVKFFMKFKPINEYQLGVVTRAACYQKEAAFFGTAFTDMRTLLRYKSIPECYLKDCESVIVLEDLSVSGYKNCSNVVGFDLKHAHAAIRALADVHAASLVFEHRSGKQLDELFSHDILKPWFSPIPDSPGYRENLSAADIISRVVDKYFSHKYPDHVIDKAKKLYFGYSHYCGSKSSKYRNAVSHQDLWCNNIMFKYGEDGSVENAVLIDFQIFGYCPPSLDLLTMIYCNLEQDVRSKGMDKLLDYYYECLSSNIEQHKLNPDEILSREEFVSSMEETRPVALAGAPIYTHVAAAPDEEMMQFLEDFEKFKTFLEKDRSIVLDMLEKHDYYRDRVLTIIEELLQYLNG